MRISAVALVFPALLLFGQVAFGQAPGAPEKSPDAPALPAVPEASPYPLPASPPPAEGQPAPPPPPKPVDQVQIKVWISETSEQGLRELGTNLNYTRFVRGVEQSGSLQQVTTNVFDPRNLSFGVTLPSPNPTLFGKPLRPDQNNGPENGIQTQAGVGLVANVISPDYGTVDAIFRGIEQKADADLISKPEILVIDNGAAEIHAGSQIPYQNITYSVYGTQLNVTWKNIGVNLKLRPLILPNDTVQIDIEQLGVSDVIRIDNIRGLDLPVFATREQSGVVIVPNNQTLVIGGLSSRVVQKMERRVPVLGSLPLVGMGFRGRSSKAVNSLLLIFVSPTVVNLRSLTPEAQDALEFWRMQNWDNKDRISKEIQVMQEEP